MKSSKDGKNPVDEVITPSPLSSLTSSAIESPQFQLSNLFVSPLTTTSTGQPAEGSATAARRTAGNWRSQWAPSSSSNGKSVSSTKSTDGGGTTEREAGSSIANEGPRGGFSGRKGDLNRDSSSIWEQQTNPSLMTPPGTINELPSFGSSSPALQNGPSDVPWSTVSAKSGDYDWANFVYAYARGRWDPVRLPQPPNRSNVIPGATTLIGVQTERYTRPATPEAPEKVLEIRRPSLNYTQSKSGTASSERLPTIDAQFSPSTSSKSLASKDSLSFSHLDFEGRTEDAVLGEYSNKEVQKSRSPQSKSPDGKSTDQPDFINPFSILQLASSSAPNVGLVTKLSEVAQRHNEEQDSDHNSPIQGAKTDSELITREALSRRESQYTQMQDHEIWSDSSLFSPADRQTGVLPFVSPSTMPAQLRPGFDTKMSEFALNDNQSVGNETKHRDSLYDQRPRPTPVQLLGANLRLGDLHTDTWASAPDASQSTSTSFSVSSHGHITMRDESSSVSGLRRAARRTSIKRTDGSRDMVRDISTTSHSRSFPSADTYEAVIREVPSLDQIQQYSNSGSSEMRLEDSTQSLSNAKSGDAAKLNKDDSDLTKPVSRFRAGSAEGMSALKMPHNLAQMRQTGSNPALTTYLNVGKRVEQFYRDFGYLPSIIPPDEQNRRQALRRYGPPKMHGDTNFDRIGHLVKLVFNTKLVLISLVGEKSQFFQTEVGSSSSGFTGEWLRDIAKSRDCSLCSHAILQQTDEPLVILDAKKDWRFAGNPLVKGPPYIRFYAGSPLRTADGYNLGSLCIVDDHPWTEFNPRQRHTLKEFSRVVMREMELSRDTIHLRIRDRMQHSIETFTRECLEMESSDVEDKDEDNSGLHKVYAFAAKGMREALNASGAIVFDLSHFELVVSGPQSHDEEGSSRIFFPSPYQYPDITPFANFEHPESIEGVNLANDTSLYENAKLEEKSVPPMAVLGASELDAAPEDRDRPVPLSHYLKVAEFLRKYRTGHYFPFTPLPFRHLLPSGMTNVLLVPIFGLNKQPFALLCAYSKPVEGVASLEDMAESGLQYLRAMGTIILSAILKKDIMLADKAKSHFISNISHELRTPLHGILAAAELLAETKLNSTQGSYLETVEACGKSLLELVNHVLDFTKLSGNSRVSQQSKPTQKCDLVKLLQEVCESSWIGQMAKQLESEQNSGIGSAYAKGSEASSPNAEIDEPQLSIKEQKQKILQQASSVDTVIDISHRAKGWLVKCDAGGIRRVLMNLIGNSLKFTTAGFVHVSVREVQSTDTHVVVELGVTDTGKGISRTFLEEQLFHPFTQENHLGPGTGLGLSIVNSIVQSPAINGKIDVWSTLGQGTEIRVTCELELCSPSDEAVSKNSYRPTLQVDQKRSVSFIGFQENLRGQSDLKEVLRNYYEDWWKFNITKGIEGDLVVINENVDLLDDIVSQRKITGRTLPPVIVLTGARGDGRVARACDDYQDMGGLARLLFKPAGPARLESVTEICLQRLEGMMTGVTESHQSTPLASPGSSKEANSETYFERDTTPLQEDTLTPRGHPSLFDGQVIVASDTRPGTSPRPFANNNNELRRNSPHVSPGPPDLQNSASLLRRHSSGGRVPRAGAAAAVNGERQHSPRSSSSKEDSKRPLMPGRSNTSHEHNLQRQVLMSPLRSPYNNSRPGVEANDYFGSISPNAAFAYLSGSSTDAQSPSTPGSVISLEGGEGAVLKSAIHTAGLLRGGVSKKRLRVLSVEDNSINRKVLAAYFGKMEVDFIEAVNGQEGVTIFESYPMNYFDVIFMDLSMPVLDGLGATLQIRKIEAERFQLDHVSQHQAWSKIAKSTSMVLSTPGGSRPSAQARAKIFTLTGRSSDEDKRRAFATGADGFIVKPLSFKVLSSLLSRISARSV